MLDRRGRPLPAAARRPLPHCLELCRDRPQTEVRIGNGNAGERVSSIDPPAVVAARAGQVQASRGLPAQRCMVEQPGVEFLQVFEGSLGVKKRSRTARPGSRPGPSPSPTPACRPPARQDRNPDQRQPFRRRLRRIGRQKPLKLIAPCTQPMQRLMLAHVAELRLPRTQGPCGPPPERPSIPGRSA